MNNIQYKTTNGIMTAYIHYLLIMPEYQHIGIGEKLVKMVMDSVVEILKLPSNDRNIRLIEYKSDFFQMKPPYEILIEISLIILNEQPLENWGGRGGISCDEMELGFKVNV